MSGAGVTGAGVTGDAGALGVGRVCTVSTSRGGAAGASGATEGRAEGARNTTGVSGRGRGRGVTVGVTRGGVVDGAMEGVRMGGVRVSTITCVPGRRVGGVDEGACVEGVRSGGGSVDGAVDGRRGRKMAPAIADNGMSIDTDEPPPEDEPPGMRVGGVRFGGACSVGRVFVGAAPGTVCGVGLGAVTARLLIVGAGRGEVVVAFCAWAALATVSASTQAIPGFERPRMTVSHRTTIARRPSSQKRSCAAPASQHTGCVLAY